MMWLTIRDEDAIKRSVKNIIFTILGEKPFEPHLGQLLMNLCLI